MQHKCTQYGFTEQPPPVKVLLGSAHWAQQYVEHLPTPLLLLRLQPSDCADPIALGNRLSEAVEAAYGSPLFGRGMSFEYGLRVIHQHRDLLEPFKFLVLHSDGAPGLVEALVRHFPHAVWLHLDHLVPDLLSPNQAQIIQEPLMDFSAPPAQECGDCVNLDLLLQRSIRKAQWGRALDLLICLAPPTFVDQLEPIASKLIEQGEYRKLYEALKTLPRAAEDPRLLRWLLEAAMALGEQHHWLTSLEKALEHNPPPELRAASLEVFFYTGRPEIALAQTRRAAKEAPAPFTLYQLGRALQTTSPQASLVQLKHALRLAEQRGDAFNTTRICLALAQTHTQLGEFAAAETWAEQGLRWLHQKSSSNTLLQLQLFNELAYVRTLLGETLGLEEQLRREIGHLLGVAPSWARLLRSTLGELLIAEGRGEEARQIFAEIWQEIDRREMYNRYCDGYVRALLECGELEAAQRIALQAHRLTEDLPPLYRRGARLALAMVVSLSEPFKGLEMLKDSLEEMQGQMGHQHLRAILYKLRALDMVGNYPKAQELFEQYRPQLQALGLSGLRLLGGPEEWFSNVLRTVSGKQAPLEMWFLGRISARWEGQPLELRQRLADYLATLVLSPEGVSLDKLATEVYADAANTNTTKAQIAQLKKLIPIEANPYRLGTPFWADFTELRQLIKSGRLRESLRLYRGPLLPESKAKNIENERWYLQEMLRAAVLLSGDAECLWVMSNLIPDDLELWEMTLEVLQPGDYRKILAQGYVRNLSA